MIILIMIVIVIRHYKSIYTIMQHVCIYIYIHTYIYIYTYVYIYLSLSLSLYMYIYIYIYVYVCMYVCMYVRTYVRTYVCTYVCMYVCMCIYIYIHTHAYVDERGAADPTGRRPSRRESTLVIVCNSERMLGFGSPGKNVNRGKLGLFLRPLGKELQPKYYF